MLRRHGGLGDENGGGRVVRGGVAPFGKLFCCVEKCSGMTRVGFVGVGVGRCCSLGVVAVPVFSFAWFVWAEAARAIASFVPGAVRRVLIANVFVAGVGIGSL